MTIKNQKVLTIADYEFRPMEFDEFDRPIIAERLDYQNRNRDDFLNDPLSVNELVLPLAESI